jgi:hypothetical protein
MKKYTLIAQREMINASGTNNPRGRTQNNSLNRVQEYKKDNSISSFYLCHAEINSEHVK